MRSRATPPDRNNRFVRLVKHGQQAGTVQAPPAARQAKPQIRARASTSTWPHSNVTQAHRLLSPIGANRATSAIAQRVAAASPASSKPLNYTVQAPIHLGRGQQIRATIQGTPQVAGSIEISPRGGGKIYISNLNVDQQHRRRGVASKLIDAAINIARRQGYRAAALEARPSDNGISSQALVAMYRRQGFKSLGKSGRGNPLMERKL